MSCERGRREKAKWTKVALEWLKARCLSKILRIIFYVQVHVLEQSICNANRRNRVHRQAGAKSSERKTKKKRKKEEEKRQTVVIYLPLFFSPRNKSKSSTFGQWAPEHCRLSLLALFYFISRKPSISFATSITPIRNKYICILMNGFSYIVREKIRVSSSLEHWKYKWIHRFNQLLWAMGEIKTVRKPTTLACSSSSNWSSVLCF